MFQTLVIQSSNINATPYVPALLMMPWLDVSVVNQQGLAKVVGAELTKHLGGELGAEVEERLQHVEWVLAVQ